MLVSVLLHAGNYTLVIWVTNVEWTWLGLEWSILHGVITRLLFAEYFLNTRDCSEDIFMHILGID